MMEDSIYEYSIQQFHMDIEILRKNEEGIKNSEWLTTKYQTVQS